MEEETDMKSNGTFRDYTNAPRNLPLKGKAIPLQAWTGPKLSRRMRLPDIKTIGT
jgi:hypothetical protein